MIGVITLNPMIVIQKYSRIYKPIIIDTDNWKPAQTRKNKIFFLKCSVSVSSSWLFSGI